ncbi:MAG: deoxyhypusine synthase [Chlorobiota bacterium]
MPTKREYLRPEAAVEHFDITRYPDIAPLVEAMGRMAFQARNLHRAARIYEQMLQDERCTVILCLAGSLVSAGLRRVIADAIRFRMVDVIVSTGAIIVDQDFFEALGFRHYQGSPRVDDDELRELMIDRIYDTFIDEEELRVCDHTVAELAEQLPPGVYSSREFIAAMGQYLVARGIGEESIVRTAYEHGVPIFVPAFSDCSAGFGLVLHQHRHPERHVAIDSVKDFRELTYLKIRAGETGLVMVGGGVPKNFAQDVVVAADILGHAVPMHKYAIQITVADERDGGLSGSTLREASSWGKVAGTYEQMVFAEATLALPLLVGYVYHRGVWRQRQLRRWLDAFIAPEALRPAALSLP